MKRARRIAVAALACALLASCARGPRPGLGLDAVADRSRVDAHRREIRLAAFEGDLVVRVDGRATGRLPGVVVRAALAAPDRARLRATWLLGTAFDVSARGDTVTAWLPTERAWFEVPTSADSLGVPAPARFLCRALGATWQPPLEAWKTAARLDSTAWRVAWSEDGEQASGSFADDGRPTAITFTRDDRSITVRYLAWQGSGDDAWPSRLEVADGAGWVRVRIEQETPRFAASPRNDWFSLDLPPDARRLDLEELRRAISHRERAR